MNGRLCTQCTETPSLSCVRDDCPHGVRNRQPSPASITPHHENTSNAATMTAASAAFRQCPMMFAQHGSRGVCIGPRCMAWRWIPIPEEIQKRHAEVSKEPAVPSLGYCGLGGIPLAHLDERTDPLLAELRVFSHFAARGQTLAQKYKPE